MASIRGLANAIGLTQADLSVISDFLGFIFDSLPTDPSGGAVSISLKRQVERLEGLHFHVNVIRIGNDQLSNANKTEIDMAIFKLRNVYDQAGVGVGRILHFGVDVADAGGLHTPTSRSDIRQITQNWTIPNDGIDLFIPLNMVVPTSGGGILLGLSPIGGTCNNKDKTTGMSGPVAGLWGATCGPGNAETARTVSHEIGHYLGLTHRNGSPTNLMCQTGSASNTCSSNDLIDQQETNIRNHCSINPGIPSADVFDGRAYSVSELRQAVFGEGATLSRPLALLVLSQRPYRDKLADLERLLMHEDEEPRLRSTAAHLLAREGTPDAIEVLRKALGVRDELTRRSVLRGLALCGDRAALTAVARVADARGPLADPAAWAARLLRYRFGEAGPGIHTAGQLLRPDPHIARSIATRQPGADAVAHAVRLLAASAPGFALTTTGAAAFSCGDRELMLLLDRDTGDQGLIARMVARRSLIGVVAERSILEGESWEVGLLVLSEPRSPDCVRLMAVTTHGRLVLDGEATVHADRADFALCSVEAPGAVPTELVGTIVEGRLQIESLLVEPTRRRPDIPQRAARN